jgi:DNA-binding NtrC family response regulator
MVSDCELARMNLIGESPAWQTTLQLVRRIAATGAPALVEGETGTGKELVTRAIHYLGERANSPFIPLNCGALPDNLLEAELFGHEKGAFTDAREQRRGLVAEARGGTLFLDEVEAMTPRAQVVLLRFLQDQTYLPIGGRVVVTADVRIVAASNANLEEQVERGQFRRDLFFRLRVLHVTLPPLRARTGDVSLLASRFLERFSKSYGRLPRRLSAASLDRLERHSWPGNVRELESLVLRAFLLHEGGDDELCIDSLTSAAGEAAPPPSASTFPTDFKVAKAQALAQFERSYLRELLARACGNLSLAARLSRKDRGALKKLAKKHGIAASDFRQSKTA